MFNENNPEELGIPKKRIAELPENAIVHELFPLDTQLREQRFLYTLMILARKYGQSSWDITWEPPTPRVKNGSDVYKRLKERQAITEQLAYIVCNVTKEDWKNEKTRLSVRYYFGTLKLAAILCNDAGSYEKAKIMIDNNFFSDALPIWKAWAENFAFNLKVDPFKMLTDLEALDNILVKADDRSYGIKFFMDLARNAINGAKDAKKSE
jgi:hypothetical protein